jgi:hypothetical protein
LREVQELHALWLESDLLEESLHSEDPYFSTIVSLGQLALPLGARNHAHPPGSPFKSVEEVLHVDLPRARYLLYEYADALLLPLARQDFGSGDAIVANV